MQKLTITLKNKQFQMLQRIAKADNRKIEDFLYIILGTGLDCHFCDTGISVPKLPDEYSKKDLEQLQLNKKLENMKHEGKSFYSLNYEERKALGHDYVMKCLTNTYNENGPDFIEQLASDIKENSLINLLN